MVSTENIPLTIVRVGLLFVEKREPAELGPREGASNILGFFIIKILLNITVFLLTKDLIFSMCSLITSA